MLAGWNFFVFGVGDVVGQGAVGAACAARVWACCRARVARRSVPASMPEAMDSV